MKEFIFLLILSLLSVGDVRGAEPQPFSYRPVSQADLETVRNDWADRDLSARQVEIVYDEEHEGFQLLVVRHDVSSRAHFGAILVPNVEDLSKAPVVVLPDHLEQYNPTIDIGLNIEKYLSHVPTAQLKEFVMILPSFRGRFMSYKDNGWFSRGDFCDAYDGPTDDSIALLNTAEQLLPEVNFDNVLVWGGSRGGNTALLMAIRDPRVQTVIAVAAPVDFYREDWQVEGDNQYRCQFFDGKSEQESRHLILASSPLLFKPHDHLENVFLHHDAGDDVVPVWNANEMETHLESQSVDVTKFVYLTEGHGYLAGEESFWRNIQDEISEFLESAEN